MFFHICGRTTFITNITSATHVCQSYLIHFGLIMQYGDMDLIQLRVRSSFQGNVCLNTQYSKPHVVFEIYALEIISIFPTEQRHRHWMTKYTRLLNSLYVQKVETVKYSGPWIRWRLLLCVCPGDCVFNLVDKPINNNVKKKTRALTKSFCTSSTIGLLGWIVITRTSWWLIYAHADAQTRIHIDTHMQAMAMASGET